MLCLTRRPGQKIDITLEDGRRIEIMFSGVRGNQVNVAIDAPKSITIDRGEVTKRKWDEEHPEKVNGNV